MAEDDLIATLRKDKSPEEEKIERRLGAEYKKGGIGMVYTELRNRNKMTEAEKTIDMSIDHYMRDSNQRNPARLCIEDKGGEYIKDGTEILYLAFDTKEPVAKRTYKITEEKDGKKVELDKLPLVVNRITVVGKK